MDPRQTLADALDREQAGDLDEALALLEAYWNWRRKGGFEPPRGDRLAQRLHNRIAQASRPPQSPDPDRHRDGEDADTDDTDS